MNMNMKGLIITTIITIIASTFTGLVNSTRKYKYESSYAFAEVESEGKITQFCANFQHWKTRDLPASAAEAPINQLDWWIHPNETDICTQRDVGAKPFSPKSIVPALYRTMKEDTISCEYREGYNKSDNRQVRNQVEIMRAQGAKNIIFLVKKGKLNAYISHDYLFTHFYNAEIDSTGEEEAMNIFYAYETVFWQNIQPILSRNQTTTNLRFYQPQSTLPMDPAVFVLWFFAVISILIGSLWAAAETRKKLAMADSRLHHLGIGIGTSSQTELTVEDGAEADVNNIRPSQKSQMKRTDSIELAQMSGWKHCAWVGCSLGFVVFILLFSFFFRNIAIKLFNIIFIIFGTLSLHSCIYCPLNWLMGGKDWKICTIRGIFGGRRSSAVDNENEDGAAIPDEMPQNGNFPPNANVPSSPTSSPNSVSVAPSSQTSLSSSCLDHPIRLVSFLVFLFSFLICLFWYAIRHHHLSFILLDSINIALSISAIRISRIRSFRLLTFLLFAMFAYDIFMVFGTRLLTPDGCSVMVQVVTGTDCRPSPRSSNATMLQPLPPIEANIPEKLPLLFYVPMLADPMAQCYDVEVETEYKRVMLGLGDVILPGYLIAYCFYVDIVERNKFPHGYGPISMIGYSLGMVCTFIAMLLMDTAQPALIYLVPFTFFPICLWALLGDKKNGTFGRMWRGEIHI